MNIKEARKIAEVIAQANGGCSYCVSDLIEQLNERFPEFKWIRSNYDTAWTTGVGVIERGLNES